jgi:hypothetical protein
VDLAIDFIEGLPKVAGKSVILTVVDRFSKYTHFIPLGHPYTTTSVAQAFFNGIVRLHGFPSSIDGDWDPVFTPARPFQHGEHQAAQEHDIPPAD